MGVRNCGEFGPILHSIATVLANNKKLGKLLYYTDTTPLDGADVSAATIFGEYIKIVPKVSSDNEKNTVVLLIRTANNDNANDEYKNVELSVYVYNPLTQWIISGAAHNLRPFEVIGEIQNTLYKKRVNGLGVITGGDFDLEMLTDDMSCYVIHFNIDVFA